MLCLKTFEITASETAACGEWRHAEQALDHLCTSGIYSHVWLGAGVFDMPTAGMTCTALTDAYPSVYMVVGLLWYWYDSACRCTLNFCFQKGRTSMTKAQSKHLNPHSKSVTHLLDKTLCNSVVLESCEQGLAGQQISIQQSNKGRVGLKSRYQPKSQLHHVQSTSRKPLAGTACVPTGIPSSNATSFLATTRM